MKIEDQVCSLELAKKLKEFGVKQESLFAWKPFYSITDDKYIDWDGKFTLKYDPQIFTTGQEVFKPWYTKYIELEAMKIPAFTVAELGELLPEKVCWRGYVNYGGNWTFEFGDKDSGPYYKSSDRTEADARAKMLVYLLKNNLTTL